MTAAVPFTKLDPALWPDLDGRERVAGADASDAAHRYRMTVDALTNGLLVEVSRKRDDRRVAVYHVRLAALAQAFSTIAALHG